jgi:2-polyprenyl-3-methyl-5-hydroxy-6-metoxy-1,4-benzoquinol methylase
MTTDGVARLFESVVRVWPEHAGYLGKLEAELTSEERRFADSASDLILRIAGEDLPRICDDYRWLCGEMQREQLHFVRNGSYRLKTFEEARREVYDDDVFMTRYINGLLIGRIVWIEQLRMLRFYTEEFLAGHPARYEHLEVGPGHGLLLHFAGLDARCQSLCALDVSQSSLEATVDAMRKLGSSRLPELERRDILEGGLDPNRWNSIVASEVLEHLEEPGRALDTIAAALAPGGRAFITTPANCPMPDHIHLFESPEAIFDLVAGAGLRILESRTFTGVGIGEERARKRKLPIACAMIVERPD